MDQYSPSGLDLQPPPDQRMPFGSLMFAMTLIGLYSFGLGRSQFPHMFAAGASVVMIATVGWAILWFAHLRRSKRGIGGRIYLLLTCTGLAIWMSAAATPNGSGAHEAAVETLRPVAQSEGPRAPHSDGWTRAEAGGSAAQAAPQPLAAITRQAPEGLTPELMDATFLKNLESYLVWRINQSVAGADYAQSTGAVYVEISDQKLAVVRLLAPPTGHPVTGERVPQMAFAFVVGLQGGELVRVMCMQPGVPSVPLASGPCHTKLQEAFGLTFGFQ